MADIEQQERGHYGAPASAKRERDRKNKLFFKSYHDDQEIKPTPGIGEVCLKTISDPFEQHF